MSLYKVIDERYRLQPADLGKAGKRTVVTNITFQGLENLEIKLHFKDFIKPLVLDQQQRQTMLSLTESSNLAEWIGHEMELKLGGTEQESPILLSPVTSERASILPQSLPIEEPYTRSKLGPEARQTNHQYESVRSDRQVGRVEFNLQTIIFALILLLISALVYLLENTNFFWSLLDF